MSPSTTSPSKIDWNTGSQSSMIPVGTHSLHLSISGRPRTPNTPLILLMPGHGSTPTSWTAVHRLLTPFFRFLTYDRSGYVHSHITPSPPEIITAVDIAMELDNLLKIAGVEGPFILVAHSMGGITAREFLHLRGKEVVGMVFVDANTERSFDGGRWPRAYAESICRGVDWDDATGLTADHVLSEDEWEAVLKEKRRPSHQLTEEAETKGYPGSLHVLAAREQFQRKVLGDRPVIVITAYTGRDFSRVYEAGVRRGNGTEEERAQFREMVEGWAAKDFENQAQLLEHSSLGRHRYVERSGHNVQMVEPELIAEEVKWVWDHVVDS